MTYEAAGRTPSTLQVEASVVAGEAVDSGMWIHRKGLTCDRTGAGKLGGNGNSRCAKQQAGGAGQRGEVNGGCKGCCRPCRRDGGAVLRVGQRCPGNDRRLG